MLAADLTLTLKFAKISFKKLESSVGLKVEVRVEDKNFLNYSQNLLLKLRISKAGFNYLAFGFKDLLCKTQTLLHETYQICVSDL